MKKAKKKVGTGTKETYLFDFDLHNLHYEWRNHVRMVEKYTRKHAKAKSNLAEAKAALEMVEAEIKKDARVHPGKYGIDKITVDAVEVAVVLSIPYQRAKEEVIKCEYEYDLLQGMIRTLEHRKKALEEEVHLFSIDYFKRLKTPKNVPADKVDEFRSLRPRTVDDEVDYEYD